MSSETSLRSPAADLIHTYQQVRQRTEELCAPLTIEDYMVQSMPDASPPKWHLAHTTWFFETFILSQHIPDYQSPNPSYAYLFNSYYEGAGPQFPRPKRGTLSRPTVKEVIAWRQQVDSVVLDTLVSNRFNKKALWLIELGLQHEEQHQELLVVDIKHGLLSNPLECALTASPSAPCEPPSRDWIDVTGGLVEVGHSGLGFSFDNETPKHHVYINDFQLAKNLITNEEYVEFIEDGGYSRPELWLSDGWYTVQTNRWTSPLYWQSAEDGYYERTLGGTRKLPPYAPLTHVSFYEADAFARWKGMLLPTESEWEYAANLANPEPNGTMLDDKIYHPEGRAGASFGGFRHLLGEVWEHTSSPYRPYPGFAPHKGVVGEYNGKFMNGQYVLRGGSAATPRAHIRSTYRNFFGPDKRWIFSGIRLAKRQ